MVNSTRIFFVTLLIWQTNQSAAQVTADWINHYQSTFHVVDYGREVRTDAVGNVYVAGHSLINTNGEGIVTIVKYDATGNFVWDYHSPDANYYLEDFELDDSGNLYYAGAHWVDSTAEWDFVTVKIDPSGNDIWTRFFDGNGIGNGWDYGWAVHVDHQNNAYITGHSQGTFNGYDFLTVKYDASGNQQWVASYENPANVGQSSNYKNDAFEVVTDASLNVYVSGYTFNGTTHELTLVKYDAAGTFQWAADFDSQAEWPTTAIIKNFMKVDLSNDIYLVGNIENTGTGCDILILKYNGAGNLIWSRNWNSPTNDSDYVSTGFYDDEGLVVDQKQDVIISGTISQPGVQFGEDIVTVKYDSAGHFIWQNIFDGTGHDEDRPYGLALDPAGNAYVCGTTQTTPALGDEDYVTMKLEALTGATEWTRLFNGMVDFIDQPHAIFVDAQQNVYVTGWSALNNDPFNLRAEIVTIKYSQFPTYIDENNISGQPFVYPNPCNNLFYLDWNTTTNGTGEIFITDILGKTVFRVNKILSRGINRITIDPSTIKDGFYFININLSTEVKKIPITIIH